MRSRLVSVLKERRPRWKEEWVRRLRAEPALTAMADPAILVHLMDTTFTEFSSLIGTSPGHRWLSEHPSNLGGLRGHCRCGLNPLLTYFATGQEALDLVLREERAVPAVERGALMLLWHFLAQREIESLCGSCCRVCAPALGIGAGSYAGAGHEDER